MIEAQVVRVLKQNGILIEGMTFPNLADKSTWRVQPTSLQAAAQPYIDAFDPADPAHAMADLSAEVAGRLDNERIYSAIVWTILDTYSNPATITKFNTARTKLVAAYKAQPWKP